MLVLADAGLKSDELLALEPADVYIDEQSAERATWPSAARGRPSGCARARSR